MSEFRVVDANGDPYERLRAALAAADRYARVHREHGYGPEGQEARAALKATLAFASPDERLREAAGLLSRAKTALRAHRLNWLALSDRLDAPYPDRPDSSPWSRFALPVCQRGKLVEDEIVAALAAADREAHLEPAPQNDATRAQIVAAKLIADREAPDEGLSSVRGATFYHAVCLGCGESPDEDGAEWRATPHEAAEVATEHGWRDGRCEECQPAIDEPKETTT